MQATSGLEPQQLEPDQPAPTGAVDTADAVAFAAAHALLDAHAAMDIDGGERVSIKADALCNDGAGTLVGLFFSEQLNDIAVAKAICARCPVQERCLEGALERREPWGVWGGELFMNGRVLAYKRKRGRPPKVPRPEEVAAATGVPLSRGA